jgi:glutaconyl-CoA decarboxylase
MREYRVEIGDEEQILAVEENGDSYQITLSDGRSIKVRVTEVGAGLAVPTAAPAASASVHSPASAPVQPQVNAAAPSGPGQGSLTAPMPGVVLSLEVNAGDTITRGRTLLILEAMKMKNEIKSERDGKVAKILVKTGDQVRHGEVLMEFEP